MMQRKHQKQHRVWRQIRSLRTLLLLVLIALLSLGNGIPALAGSQFQTNDPSAKAAALLANLSPEEKVGQLFIVTFNGVRADADTQIYDLINNYHIGALMLRRDMDNFAAAPDTLQSAYTLVAQLQTAEADASQTSRSDVTSGDAYIPNYIPVLIGLSQEGDGYPSDQLLDTLSPQPNAMMLGATWNPDLARQAGELLGRELSALGVNLLLGPSLDVLTNPQPESAGDFGVRSFGGDPYWVGRMGQAYVNGIHSGSQFRVAVVAKHLPGQGDSGRPLDEEVPTVRKSLEQLSQVELPPFFAVAGDAPDKNSTVDAMLLAHIRYQGFQGNIRATTHPISFDPQAFNALMALPAFASWRQAGGVIMSDSLGTRAVRRTYDASEQVFDAPLVARDAFLAGNDLLYLGNFVASGDPNSYTTIVRTMQFFAQKYREDVAFAERVDESVLRILTLKYELYPNFNVSAVIPPTSGLDLIGKNQQLAFDISRQAATLLDPSPAELVNILPSPPGRFEQIIFITDSYGVQQCSVCEPQSSISVNALAQSALNLYGPNTGNQTTAANLSSFSFTQLTRTLDGNIVGEDALLSNLQRAEWVVIGLGKEESDRPDSMAFRRLLSERLDLIQNKNVVVFALNAPYYLDATDITKIDAYYGLYGKTSEVADIAARLLFQEINARGFSPVSVSGIGYDLIEATAPDPSETMALQVTRVLPAATEAPATPNEGGLATPELTEIPTFQAGDVLNFSAGPILDHNGNAVPDNTPVTFLITLATEQVTLQRQVNATTHSGIALGSYSIEDEGSLDILASSGEPAATSETLHFDVSGINPEGLALQATQTEQAILLASTPVPTQETAITTIPVKESRTDLVDWFLILLISGMTGLLAYQMGINLGKVRWAIRWGLTSVIGGLLMGSYLALDLPGTNSILMFSGKWGLVLAVLVGAAVGWLAGLGWREALNRRKT